MIFFSPSTRGFYMTPVHGAAMPADVVTVAKDRHRRLLAAQACGREIVANVAGRPVLSPRKMPSREERLAMAAAAIKREAARRILAVATLERQANDNAAIAALALSSATGDLPPPTAAAVPAALERRARIDAIRAFSDRLERELADMTAAQLVAFDAAEAVWTSEPTA